LTRAYEDFADADKRDGDGRYDFLAMPLPNIDREEPARPCRNLAREISIGERHGDPCTACDSGFYDAIVRGMASHCDPAVAALENLIAHR
jgi:hypothetical protein